MREILFRGKHIATGKWVIGCDIHQENKRIVAVFPADGGDSYDNYLVDPKTVGQFIVYSQKSKQNYYEHDILKSKNGRIGYIVWEVFRWCVKTKRTSKEIKQYGIMSDEDNHILIPLSDWFYGSQVIGNVHDNIELLTFIIPSQP